MDADFSVQILTMIARTQTQERMQDFQAFKPLEELQTANVSLVLFQLQTQLAQPISALNSSARDQDQTQDLLYQLETEAFCAQKKEELLSQVIEVILIAQILVLIARQLESQLVLEVVWEEEDVQVANACVTEVSKEKIVVKTFNYIIKTNSKILFFIEII